MGIAQRRDMITMAIPGKANVGEREIPLGFLSSPLKGMDGSIGTPSNYTAQLRANVSDVYSCTGLIANGLSREQLRVFKIIGAGETAKTYKKTIIRPVETARKDFLIQKATPGSMLSIADDVEEVVGGHRLVDLLHSVNAIIDNHALKFLTSAYLSLTGNCYWVLVPDNAGKLPGAIWIPSSENMRVIPDQDTLVAGYIFKSGKTTKKYALEEVIHFKQPAPGQLFMFYGRGHVNGASPAINMKGFIQQFEESIFKHGGVLSGVLSTTGRISPEQRDKLNKQFSSIYGGAQNAGKTMVMENVKYEAMSVTPRELAYQSGRAVMKGEIANAFGVPIALLDGSAKTRIGLDSAKSQLAEYAIDPQAKLIAEALNAQLAPLYPEPLVLAFDNPVPDDKEYDLLRLESHLKNGVTSIDDERTTIGLKPEGGVAEHPMIDATRIPIEMVGLQQQELTAERIAAGVRRAFRKGIDDKH